MPYSPNMRAAAYRHLLAAQSLDAGHRRDVAAYLFGIAAECAVKMMMLDSGMRPTTSADRRNDPFFAHFEGLKTLLRDTARGRRAAELIKIANDPRFMQSWDTSMRYSDGKSITPQLSDRYREDANKVVAVMDA